MPGVYPDHPAPVIRNTDNGTRRSATLQAVTQVATEFLTPSGWSAEAHEFLIFLDNSAPTPFLSRPRVSRKARSHSFRNRALTGFIPYFRSSSEQPIFLLFIGMAVVWVADGFKTKHL
jgi:hypothetical protein